MAAADNTGTQTQALAARFEQASQAVIATVAQCSDEEWQTVCPAEERSVGVVAHHIAIGYHAQLDALRAALAGRPVPAIYQDLQRLHEFNAEHAEQYAACTQGEVLDLLRRNGAAVARFIRGLSDEDLTRSAPLPLSSNTRWTVQRWVERLLIGHAEQHLRNIRAVTGA